MLGISDSSTRGIILHVAKTNALSSVAVTAKLICAFVFAQARLRFSPDEAQIRQYILDSHQTNYNNDRVIYCHMGSIIINLIYVVK